MRYSWLGLDQRLAQAIAATFNRRGTPLPIEPPAALTASFGDHAAKQLQWRGLLKKSGIEADGLAETLSLLQILLWPATHVTAAASSATARRRPGIPWNNIGAGVTGKPPAFFPRADSFSTIPGIDMTWRRGDEWTTAAAIGRAQLARDSWAL
jgi:hypothetical protein